MRVVDVGVILGGWESQVRGDEGEASKTLLDNCENAHTSQRPRPGLPMQRTSMRALYLVNQTFAYSGSLNLDCAMGRKGGGEGEEMAG